MFRFPAECILLLSCLSALAGQKPGQEPFGTGSLAPGHPVGVLLTADHETAIRVDLSNLEAAEIVLDGAAPDIAWRMTAGDGTEIVSGRTANFGWVAIPIATAGQREAQIFFRTGTTGEGLAGVHLRAELFAVPRIYFSECEHAAQVFNQARSLQRSLQAADLREATRQFQLAAGVWARTGEIHSEAMALGAAGETQIELSRYGQARQTLGKAIDLEGDTYLRGWLLHLEARVHFDQYDGRRAQEYAEKEMRLANRLNDQALTALARTDQAGVAFWLRDPSMSEILDQAHREAIAAGVPDTLALERRWRGWVEEYYERAVRGMTALSESETYFRLAGDSRNALDSVLEVAEAVSLNGDLYSALTTFAKLNPVVQASGNAMEYGINLGNIGIQYQQLNKPRLAAMYYRRANSTYAGAHILWGQMVSHGSLCETEMLLNQTGEAVSECRLSLSLAQRLRDPAFIGQALCDLGRAERTAGLLGQAFEHLNASTTYTHPTRDLRFESRERIQLGELLEQRELSKEALSQFEQAEGLSHDVADPSSLLEARYAVARWYMKHNQFDRADAELAPAIEKVEAQRRLVSTNSLQASYFAAERKCYELAVELQMRRLENAHNRDDPAGASLALELSERGRARGLLDALSAREAASGRVNDEGDIGSVQAKLAVDRAFQNRLKLLVEGHARRELDHSADELTLALGDLERSEEDLPAIRGNVAAPAPTVSAADMRQASLNSGVAFFEYALGDERSYLWVVAAGNVTAYDLPPRQKIERMVRQWRTLLFGESRDRASAPPGLQGLSTRLSCVLFANTVQPQMTSMVIVPEGELAMLPFAALPENGCSPAPSAPLVGRHEITLTPSLSVFLSRKAQPETRFDGEVAIVADPIFDATDPRAAALKWKPRERDANPAKDSETATPLPRLLNAGYEASAIQETVRQAAGDNLVYLAQGFDASVDTVLSPAMQRYRIWHLATHGVYDETTPEFSGLIFSLVRPDGGPRFGILKAHDIERLNVHAQLVVLSACDSAAGEHVSGEGVMGLSYAFLHAGATQVISTLWSVDDAKSRDLMIAFYRQYMRNGRNAAEALRQSQLAVMRRTHTSSPYYWAGFELTSVGK
jgi:CHAT domain-containing protein